MTNPEPEPLERSEALILFHRTQWLWRFCLCLPFFYLGIAWLVERIWFLPTSRAGFWPLTPAARGGLLILFGGVAVGTQAAVALVHRSFAGKLEAPDLSPKRMAELYWKRTLYLAACADTVSGLGLIVFLLIGHWTALAAFCGYSYLIYAQAYPRARLLCEALGIP